MDELNLDQAPQDKEFQLESVRLQTFVAATDLGCKKELIRKVEDNWDEKLFNTFELVSTQHPLTNQSSSIRKLPPLSMRRKHKQQKSELTHEEIQQKLIEAERRRKRRTEERLNKLTTKDLQEIQTIAQQQAEINRQKLEKKIQTTRESRCLPFYSKKDLSNKIIRFKPRYN
ncbi:uncharacterized protein TNCV_1197311 [Trichonephila clavipes]|uniref:Uncharacterized protein n=1 Tax=Trichonephila clavipes TaxID=2585209 RepID=A0A8X6V419_TRICX|nr:uncharacterized protein TNCV_1197311 [Trichonephila clavipes]